MADDTQEYHLNKNQDRILKLFYKFRFITIPLLVAYKGSKNTSNIQRTLSKLEELGYLERYFETTYKIDRKPAVYFLTPKGTTYLANSMDISKLALNMLYKNKRVSEAYRQHAVDVLATYNALKASYGSSFDTFTRQELAGFNELPENKPDLYLRGQKEYFITLSHDVQPFIGRKRLAEYITHSEDEGWDGGEYPGLLFAFNSPSDETRFLEYAKASLDSAGIEYDELPIGATTLKAIKQTPTIKEIWTFVGEDHKPKGL